MIINFELNGRPCRTEANPSMRLIDFLREDAHMLGTKEGCGEGECGACTVVINGRASLSCLTLLGQVDGTSVNTVEGLARRDGKLSALQDAFIRFGAIQCGYCTPGMLMSASALLARNPDPTEEEVRRALAGNLCRCGDYSAIVDAVLDAACVMRELGGEAEPSAVNAHDYDEAKLCAKHTDTEPVRKVRTTCLHDEPLWYAPRTLEELSDALSHATTNSHIIAGGTDLVIKMHGEGLYPDMLIDISRMEILHRIEINADGRTLSIGSAANFSDIEKNELLKKYFPSICEAAASIGSEQVRSRATIGGNVANASAAADTPPSLAAHHATVVVLDSHGQTRRCSIESVLTGGKPKYNEAIIAFEIRLPAEHSVDVFTKLGSRRAVSISKLSAVLCADIKGGRITSPVVVLGALGLTPVTAKIASSAIEGAELTEESARRFASAMSAEVDVAIPNRPSRRYKREAIKGLAVDLFAKLCKREERR